MRFGYSGAAHRAYCSIRDLVTTEHPLLTSCRCKFFTPSTKLRQGARHDGFFMAAEKLTIKTEASPCALPTRGLSTSTIVPGQDSRKPEPEENDVPKSPHVHEGGASMFIHPALRPVKTVTGGREVVLELQRSDNWIIDPPVPARPSPAFPTGPTLAERLPETRSPTMSSLYALPLTLHPLYWWSLLRTSRDHLTVFFRYLQVTRNRTTEELCEKVVDGVLGPHGTCIVFFQYVCPSFLSSNSDPVPLGIKISSCLVFVGAGAWFAALVAS